MKGLRGALIGFAIVFVLNCAVGLFLYYPPSPRFPWGVRFFAEVFGWSALVGLVGALVGFVVDITGKR